MVPPWLAENPRVGPGLAFGGEQRFVVDPDGIPELCDMLTECPRHKPTPLYELPALATRLGLGEVRVKDESQRFGFGAFKALGGVFAIYSELSSAVGAAGHANTTFADLMNGKHREITSKFTFATASSGNHGRSGKSLAQAVSAILLRRVPAEIHHVGSRRRRGRCRARGARVESGDRRRL